MLDSVLSFEIEIVINKKSLGLSVIEIDISVRESWLMSIILYGF